MYRKIKQEKEKKNYKKEMTRVKRGSVAKKRRKKIINSTESFRGSHSKLFTAANQQYMKALRYSYFDRRKNKNQFKKLWIQRIKGFSTTIGLKYNELIKNTKRKNIIINRKILAQIALKDTNTLYSIITRI